MLDAHDVLRGGGEGGREGGRGESKRREFIPPCQKGGREGGSEGGRTYPDPGPSVLFFEGVGVALL